MTTSTELVGPMPVGKVRFGGGPSIVRRDDHGRLRRRHSDATVIYDVPTNTLDPRYTACTDHHVACDCREAEHAEEMQEWAYARREIQGAIDSVLQGHRIDECMCTGCQIARSIHVYPKEH